MEFSDLQAFVAAAEHRSFTAAASGLDRTPPSLSRCIARLETELGAPLFDRLNRRAPKLAPLGEATLPHARHLLAEYERFVTLVQAIADGREGVLTVALSQAAGNYALPALQQQLSKLVAGVQLQVVECLPGPGVREALIEGEAELALVDRDFMTPELEGATFGLVEHVAVGLPRFLGTVPFPIEWQELKPLPLLLAIAGTDVVYPSSGAQPRIVHEGGSPGVLLGMAHAGMGVAILAGLSEVPGLVVRPIEISGAAQRSRMQLAWRRGAVLSASAHALVDSVRGRLLEREPRFLRSQ
jgi:LysR family transcriptional activator of glutamate synthase operon